MSYRTSESINALYGYLQEETCNELLDLSPWLNHGWPNDELRDTVMLLRALIESADITQVELFAKGFTSSLLNKTLPFLDEKCVAPESSCSAEVSLNHLYDPMLPIMKVVTGGGYSLHRLNAKWMRVSTESNDKTQEWIMLKRNNQLVGWVLMPAV